MYSFSLSVYNMEFLPDMAAMWFCSLILSYLLNLPPSIISQCDKSWETWVHVKGTKDKLTKLISLLLIRGLSFFSHALCLLPSKLVKETIFLSCIKIFFIIVFFFLRSEHMSQFCHPDSTRHPAISPQCQPQLQRKAQPMSHTSGQPASHD